MTLSKILKVMKFALLNPEIHDETFVKDKFGKRTYLLFSQFCLGGHKDSLAHYIGGGKLKLTQKGVREYHKLESENAQRFFNKLMLVATIILAISTSILVYISWI